MKKKLVSLAGMLLGAALTMQLTAAVEPYDQSAALAKAQADVANWQSYLPDNVFVAHVSLPGTHDAATAHDWASSTGPTYSTTQDAKLDEQLASGIRAFDFRPGMESGKLYCNHGTDRLKLTLEEAFTMLTDYLDAHPGEFYVIHLFRGNIFRTGEASTGNKFLGAKDDAASQAQYNALFNSFFNEGKFADYIVEYSPYLKVKDIRGKMVIFRRDRIDFAHIFKGGNLSGWPGGEENWTEGSTTDVTLDSNPMIKGKLRATDVSSPDNDSQLQIELNSLTNLFNFNVSQQTPNQQKQADSSYKPYWTMMFTSGAYNGENTNGYLRNATYTNPHFTGLLRTAQQNGKTGPTGTVFSDWVLRDSHSGNATMGVDLVPAIYENNFHYIQDYILDDEIFTDGDDEVESYWDENSQYFMRNAATGEYLSSGAWWGTHATTGKYGIRVTPRYNPYDKCYQIITTFRQGNTENGLGDNMYVDNTAPAGLNVKYVGNNLFQFTLQSDGRALASVASGPFPDGTEHIVDLADSDPSDPSQLWEVVKFDDLLKQQIEIASPSNPQDISYYVQSNRFYPNEADSPTGSHGATVNTPTWTGKTYIIKWATSTRGYSEFLSSGDGGTKLPFNAHGPKASSGGGDGTKWELKGTISGLPAGDYTLSFKAAYYVISMSDKSHRFNLQHGTVTEDLRPLLADGGTHDRLAMLNKFNADPDKYTLSFDFTLAENENIVFDFAKGGNSSETSFFMDDIRIIYKGKPVKVEWTMEGAQYDAIMLPFEAECPEGLTLYEADENDVTYNNTHSIINLSESKVAGRIEANKPYFVKAEGNVNSRAAGMQGTTFTFEGYPEYESDTYTSGLLTGTHNGTALGKTQHVMLHGAVGNESNTSWFDMAANDEDKYVAPHHAYIDTANFPAQTFNGYKIFMENHPGNGDNDVTTGIEGISDDAEAGIVDVYSLTGVKLRSNVSAAEALEGLEPGVYVIRQNGNGSAQLKAKNK